MLLGNKVDKPGKVVTTDMGNAWAAEMGFGFMEVSAKTGLGIQAAFEAIVTQMHTSATAGRGSSQQEKSTTDTNATQNNDNLQLKANDPKEAKPKKKGCGC